MTNELKPCPFCGSDSINTYENENAMNWEGAIFWSVKAWCECNACGARGSEVEIYGEEEVNAEIPSLNNLFEAAKKAWNNRAYEE